MKRLVGQKVVIIFINGEEKAKAKVIGIATEGLFCKKDSTISFYFHKDIREIIIIKPDNWNNVR